jgi:hypothetical protein
LACFVDDKSSIDYVTADDHLSGNRISIDYITSTRDAGISIDYNTSDHYHSIDCPSIDDFASNSFCAAACEIYRPFDGTANKLLTFACLVNSCSGRHR